MWHSVKEIGDRYEDLSFARKESIKFISKDFILFAEENENKYGLIKENGVLKVSTWYSNDLINDFNKQK